MAPAFHGWCCPPTSQKWGTVAGRLTVAMGLLVQHDLILLVILSTLLVQLSFTSYHQVAKFIIPMAKG
jgi:hypothetical protein